MKKIIYLLLVTMLTTQVSIAQKLKGNKKVISENRDIENFNSFIVKDKINVILEESPINKVSVKTDENLLYIVETDINEEGILEIYLSQEVGRNKSLKVFLGVTESLQYIEAQDNAKVTCENEIYIKNLDVLSKDNASVQLSFKANAINIKGMDKSDMDLTLNVEKDISIDLDQNCSLKMNASADKIGALLKTSSTFEPKGNCNEFVITSNGKTNMKGIEMLTDYADVKASDKANVYVNVAKELIINTEHLTEIFIYGSPKIFIDKFTDKASLYKK